MESMTDQWMVLAEAAMKARKNREQMLRLVQSGSIAGRMNLSGRWEVRRDSLTAFLRSNRRVDVPANEAAQRPSSVAAGAQRLLAVSHQPTAPLRPKEAEEHH
jgi:hypothetical protein